MRTRVLHDMSVLPIVSQGVAKLKKDFWAKIAQSTSPPLQKWALIEGSFGVSVEGSKNSVELRVGVLPGFQNRAYTNR